MSEIAKKKSVMQRFLDVVERAGNRLPDPIYIFIYLSIIIVALSFILSNLGVSAVNPATKEVIKVQNLISKPYLGQMINDGAKIFTDFPPLGIVLVVMLGIGVAEGSGYFEKLITFTIKKAPAKLILPIIILVSICSNGFGDAGPIVIPPLAAIIFLNMGYHPIAGMCMAYAAVLGAFAANLFPGMSDILVFKFSEPAAFLINPNIKLNALMNYYFIVASTPILLIVIYLVTTKVVIPRFGEYKGHPQNRLVEANTEDLDVKKTDKALRAANISLLITVLIIFALSFPKGALLRNQETGAAMTDSPLMNGIGIIITICFLVPGLVYGIKAGTIKSPKDVSDLFTKSMSSMAGYIVIVFFTAQMLAYFSWSNLGIILAIKGAELLQSTNGPVLIVGVIILSAIINIFMGSASAKWALLAPIFVPMFMLLGYHPAYTQMIYRIGDAITNPLTPMLPYMVLILAIAKDYDENVGFGTLISAMVPYSIAIGIIWTILALVWYFLGLPLGPDSPVMLSMIAPFFG